MQVVVADESLLFRHGLSRVLAELGIEVAAQVGSTAELMQLVAMHRPDVVVLGIRMPPHSDEGLAAAAEIRRTHPGVGVLLLAPHVQTEVLSLLHEGGRVGYLLKDRIVDRDGFSRAITTVAEGGTVVDPAVVSALVSSRPGDR